MQISNRYNVIQILEDFAVGDLGRVIAGYKFYELNTLINAAVYPLQESKKQEDYNLKFYFLKNAILEYNSCYDYFLQIVYFAFDFFDHIGSPEGYQQILKKVKYEPNITDKNKKPKSKFSKDVYQLREDNKVANDFFNEFDNRYCFVSNPDIGIKEWVNNLKHQGGFVAEDLLQKDRAAFMNCFFHSELTFSTKWLYPYTPSFKEIIKRLDSQHENVNNFAGWLFKYIYGDTQMINFQLKEKSFSAKKCNIIKNTSVIPYKK